MVHLIESYTKIWSTISTPNSFRIFSWKKCLEKCLQIYQYGICKCFELIIFQEEQIFRKSLAFASGIKYPVLPENIEDPKALEKYDKQKAKYEQKISNLCVK